MRIIDPENKHKKCLNIQEKIEKIGCCGKPMYRKKVKLCKVFNQRPSAPLCEGCTHFKS